jgi:hypothetical protein
MDWRGFRNQILAKHSASPQNSHALDLAIRSAEEAMSVLAKHGHHFHLAPGDGPSFSDWPKKMFHMDAAPNGRLVQNEYELWDLGEGWCETLEEAQHSDGMATQFRGRAGVNRRALPVAKPESQKSKEEWLKEQKDEKRRIIEEWKKRNKEV